MAQYRNNNQLEIKASLEPRGFFVHDIQIRWVEGESGGWKSVGDQVDPEKLDWDEGFWDAEGGGEEDANDFTDV